MAKKPEPLPADPPEAEQLPASPPAAAQLPALTWEDYVDLRRQLEARLVALAAQWASSQVWPRWFYHATQVPRIVMTRAEAQALGPGWSVTPG